MEFNLHEEGAMVPRYKSKHVPKLSLLPFEIDAPGSQLTPPTSYESPYEQHFAPRASPAARQESEFMSEGYFSQNRLHDPHTNHRRKKSGNAKKYVPNNMRFPEFIPHHSRGNSSTSTWAKSSTSSATLAVAESRTVLTYPPRKASEVIIEAPSRKGSEAPSQRSFTGENRRRTARNYSLPSNTLEGGMNTDSMGEEDNNFPYEDYLFERNNSIARLLPNPLDLSRKQSLGSLRTPLGVPGDNLAMPVPPSPACLLREPPSLSSLLDIPRKDSSTLPTGVEDMPPAMVRSLSTPHEKYRSQMLGNPFAPEQVPAIPSPLSDRRPTIERSVTSPQYAYQTEETRDTFQAAKNSPTSSEGFSDDKFDPEMWPLPEKEKKAKTDRFSFLKLSLAAIDMTDTASIYTARRAPKPYSYFMEEPESKYKKVKRKSGSCWSRMSTRQIILAVTGSILLVLLAAGLSTGLIFGRPKSHGPGLTPTWRPAIGTTWQISDGQSTQTPSYRSQVYSINLFDNNASTIAALHSAGRRVICSFSAGTDESWRPDSNKFVNTTIGKAFNGSNNETWVDTTASTVRSIMAARILLAKQKGCDGVGPENVDGYLLTNTTGTGFPLTNVTAIDFVRFLALSAHKQDIAIGLKNSPGLINGTLDVLDWSLTENCALNGVCTQYQPFIQAGKPVFQLEYAMNSSAAVLESACLAKGIQHFSTLVKRSQADPWSAECPYGDPEFVAD